MDKFEIRLIKSRTPVLQFLEFFPAKAALLRLEGVSVFGSYELGLRRDDGEWQKVCRGCGRRIALPKARCLTCSLEGGSRAISHKNNTRPLRR